MLLDPTHLESDQVRAAREPFAYVIASNQLPDAARRPLIDAFPTYGSAGFFPYLATDCGATLQALVAEMSAPAFADALGARLGIAHLSSHPAMVTLSDSVHRRHGTLHTDSRSKIATALLYLNDGWTHGSAGCLRLLESGDDIDALAAPEIPPLYGTLVAFRRSERSFHGHLPFEGQRRVVQVAWLTGVDALARKTRRGRWSRWIKSLLGARDARIGAGRSDSARHG